MGGGAIRTYPASILDERAWDLAYLPSSVTKNTLDFVIYCFLLVKFLPGKDYFSYSTRIFISLFLKVFFFSFTKSLMCRIIIFKCRNDFLVF